MKLAVSILFVFYYLQNYTESTTLGGNTVSRKGVAITGDILGTPFKTKNDECNKQCLNMHSCVYWSKQTRGIEETCSLHGPSATLYRPSIWVSGKITRTTREGTSTKEEGVVYISHRLVAISNTSDEECVDHCLKRQDCVYWSKITGEGTTCQLDGINATRYNVPIWVSGKITRLTDVGTPIAVTTQESVYYVSHELASFVNTHFHDCYIHCLYRHDCMYWAKQTGADDLCKLYGPNAEQQNQTNWVSGVITRSTGFFDCIEGSARYIEDDLNMTKKANSTDECHSYCENTANCVYWSRHIGRGEQDCFLSGLFAKKVTDQNFIAGVINCTTRSGKSTIQEGMSYTDPGFGRPFLGRKFKHTNDQECINICLRRQDCAFWGKRIGEDETCIVYQSTAVLFKNPNFVSGIITRSSEKTRTTTSADLHSTTLSSYSTTT